MEEEKREMIRRYFIPFPRWAVVLIGFTIFYILSSKLELTIILLASIPLAVGFYAIKRASTGPSDSQMDSWIAEDFAALGAKSIEKCNLDPAKKIRDPVMLTGPRFRKQGGVKFAVKRGKDKKIRFNPLDVVIVHFLPDCLAVYQCALDLTTGNALNETASEYFYKDIVSVATQTDSVTIDAGQLSRDAVKFFKEAKNALINGKLQFDDGEEFRLVTSAGTSVNIFLRSEIIVKAAGGGVISTELADNAVKAIRSMLREKKAA
ncbi:MAG: hypothetical protein HC897_17305 [Thermoanaerobaculia bacterium]|nr:hypothetical protein [Thermoanaerobaculia bacterium]